MKVRYAALTHVGRKREHNEDSVFVSPERLLFVVADGMGGHASGEIASRLAVEAISEAFERSSPRVGEEVDVYALAPLEERLIEAVEAANRRVLAEARSKPDLRGMGTTVVAAAIDSAGICVAHVGDSRLYRIRDGSIACLTRDHSLAEMLRDAHVDRGGDPAQAPEAPHNVIMRAVGIGESVIVDQRREPVIPGDRFVLCSDGLSGMICDEVIRDVVLRHDKPRAATDDLIDRANQAGGEDNISAIVVHCTSS